MAESKVKQYYRRGKKGLVKVKQHQRKKNWKKRAAISVGVMAGLLGTGTLAFMAKKVKYRKNIQRYATSEAVEKRARDMLKDIPDLSASQVKRGTVVIAVPGANLSEKGANIYKDYIKRIHGGGKGYTELFNNSITSSKGMLEVLKKYAKQAFWTGKNPDAENLAARALAFKMKYPDANVILVGHSSGGNIVNDTMLMMGHRNEPKIKGLTLGMGNHHFSPAAKNNTLHLIDDQDYQANMRGFQFSEKDVPRRKPDKYVAEKEDLPYYLKNHSAYYYARAYKKSINDYIKTK